MLNKSSDVHCVDLWHLLDEAKETDAGFSLLLYIAKDNWEKKLKQKFRTEERVKTHLLISGGNYTCDVLLPYLLKRIKDRFPLYPIRLGMAEEIKYENFSTIDHDIILSGYYSFSEDFNNFKKQLNKNNYDATRCCFHKDVVHLASSEEVYGSDSEENILNNFQLVRGRNFRDSSLDVEIPFGHRVTPLGREHEAPLIVSDKVYYSYLLMRHSVGLWVAYLSAPYDEKIKKLEKIENSEVVRHVVFKQEYEKIGRAVTKQAQIFMRKDLEHDKNRSRKNGEEQRFRI